MTAVRLNLDPLRSLRRKTAELNGMRAQVGFFQDTAGRSADAGRISDNPSLAAVHEFGLSYTIRSTKATVVIPERSILRMPLTLHLGKMILAKGLNWLYVLQSRGPRRVLQLLGLVGEDIVQEAFSTGGFGFWPKLARRTIRRKGTATILIESSQLRKAVGSRVV